MKLFSVRPILHSTSLTFKCQSTGVVLVAPPALAGRILWNRVCPSFHPVAFPGVFLELNCQFSFAMVLESLIKFCVADLEFLGKTFFAPRIGFLKLKKNWIVTFHWIYSIMKIYIISSLPVQFLYYGKSLICEILAKMLSASQITGLLNQLFIQNKSIKQPYFLHFDTNSQILKAH